MVLISLSIIIWIGWKDDAASVADFHSLLLNYIELNALPRTGLTKSFGFLMQKLSPDMPLQLASETLLRMFRARVHHHRQGQVLSCIQNNG